MLFNVYQINMTSAQVDIINGPGPTPEFYTEYLDTIMKPTKESVIKASHQYKLVAQITADNLDGVFLVGNMGPEENIKRLGKMHSLSVGDVIDDTQTKKLWVVDSFGFFEIDPKEFKAL